MNPMRHATEVGLRRGRVEFMNSLRTPQDMGYYVVGSLVFLTVMILNRNNEVEGTGVSFSVLMFPGVLAMVMAFGAAFGLATVVSTEREDGTLLRAKSVPHGMTGYVAGQVTRTSLETVFSVGLLVVPATLILGGLWGNGVTGMAHALALFALGLLACMPLGFAVGSVFKNPRSVGGWGFLIMGGLIWVSGLFAPLSTMPGWVQPIAQVFPLYWLGLGFRSAILPDSAAGIEIGESWRIAETFGVLGVWAVAGLVLAPVLLRRMARRESGSTVAERRESALKRV